MLAENLGGVHPPEVSELVGAGQKLIDVVEMGLFLCVLEEIDVFVLLEREDEKSGVVPALEEGDSDHPDEGDHTLRGA